MGWNLLCLVPHYLLLRAHLHVGQLLHRLEVGHRLDAALRLLERLLHQLSGVWDLLGIIFLEAEGWHLPDLLWLLEAEKALEDDARVQHPLGDGTVRLGHLSIQGYAHLLGLWLDEGLLDRTENLIIFLVQLNHALLGHAALSVLLDHLGRRDLGDDIRR